MTLSQNDFQVSMRDQIEMASEPMTPQAAHSVAVAQPKISEAKTSRIRSVQGMRLADSFSRSRKVRCFRSSGGVLSGLRSDHQMI